MRTSAGWLGAGTAEGHDVSPVRPGQTGAAPIFVAGQADDADYVELTGLTLAALNTGARVILTTR